MYIFLKKLLVRASEVQTYNPHPWNAETGKSHIQVQLRLLVSSRLAWGYLLDSVFEILTNQIKNFLVY